MTRNGAELAIQLLTIVFPVILVIGTSKKIAQRVVLLDVVEIVSPQMVRVHSLVQLDGGEHFAIKHVHLNARVFQTMVHAQLHVPVDGGELTVTSRAHLRVLIVGIIVGNANHVLQDIGERLAGSYVKDVLCVIFTLQVVRLFVRRVLVWLLIIIQLHKYLVQI